VSNHSCLFFGFKLFVYFVSVISFGCFCIKLFLAKYGHLFADESLRNYSLTQHFMFLNIFKSDIGVLYCI